MNISYELRQNGNSFNGKSAVKVVPMTRYQRRNLELKMVIAKRWKEFDRLG